MKGMNLLENIGLAIVKGRASNEFKIFRPRANFGNVDD